MSVFVLPSNQIERVYPLIPKFLAEMGQPEPFVPAAFHKFWSFLYSIDMGRILAVEFGSKIIGALGYSEHEDPYTAGKIISEQFWYVDPEHRASRVGLQLIDAFEKRAEKLGKDWIFLCNLASLEGEKMDRLYTRKGFKQMERVYWKKLEGKKV
jgi:GNAT superfamily N-acetyltransferase